MAHYTLEVSDECGMEEIPLTAATPDAARGHVEAAVTAWVRDGDQEGPVLAFWTLKKDGATLAEGSLTVDVSPAGGAN